MESIHTFGMCLMILEILAKLDMVKCLLVMCGVGFVPAVLNLFLGLRPENNTAKKVGFVTLDFLAVICQISCLVLLVLLDVNSETGKYWVLFYSFLTVVDNIS